MGDVGWDVVTREEPDRDTIVVPEGCEDAATRLIEAGPVAKRAPILDAAASVIVVESIAAVLEYSASHISW